MGKRQVCILLLLGLIISVFSFAQVSGKPEETRRLLLFFEVLPGSDFSEEEQALLYETLLIKLADASPRVAPKDFGNSYIPPSDTEKTDAAEQMEADSWLHIVVSGNFASCTLAVRLLDMLTGQIALDKTVEKTYRRGARDLQRENWEDFTGPIAEYYLTALSKDINRGTLYFEALPGTRIQGSAWKRLKVAKDGQTSTDVPLPATLPYRAIKPGYLPVEGQIYMDQTEKIVSLPQEQGARFGFDLYLNNLTFPGFDFIYFFVPDSVFGKVGMLTYLLGIDLDDGDRDEGNVFVSHTLSHCNLSLGFYLNAPDRYVRPYVSVGAFWRIITASGYWGLEPIAPFGAQPTFGIEYSRLPNRKIYLDFSPYVYWTGSRNNTFLMRASFPPDRRLFSPGKSGNSPG
jgi:hypothetical protein